MQIISRRTSRSLFLIIISAALASSAGITARADDAAATKTKPTKTAKPVKPAAPEQKPDAQKPDAKPAQDTTVPPAPLGQGLDKLGRLPPKGWVYQSLQGVLPDMAERLHLALLQDGKSSMSKDGVSVAFQWQVLGSHKSAQGFDLTAHMIGDYQIFNGGGGPFGWIKRAFNSDKQMSFRYDKTVLIEYDANAKLLSVTMPEAAEQIGTYNVVVSGKSKSDFAVKPDVNIASKSFGISLQTSKDQYTAAVTGLPYVLAPQLVLQSLGQARYLNMKIGFNWESRGQLVAQSSGIENKSNVNMSLKYAGTDVASEIAGSSSNTPFQGTISVKGDGQGLFAGLVYMEQVGGWKSELSADQTWQIASSTMPILKVGDVHTTQTAMFNTQSPSAPRDDATRPTSDLNPIYVSASTAVDRVNGLQSTYGRTIGLVGALPMPIAPIAPAPPQQDPSTSKTTKPKTTKTSRPSKTTKNAP